MHQGWGIGVRAWGLLLFLGGAAGAPAQAFEFTPDRNAVPLSPSREVKGRLSDHVQFLFNRGKGAVSFRDTVLDMFTPEYLRSIKGFKSFSTTRIDLSVYEFRLFEVLGPLENLLKKGVRLRFVADPSTFTKFAPLAPKQLKALTPAQQDAYIKSYDKDGDGVVTTKDAESINEDRLLAIEAHRYLESFAKRFPGQVELIQPPLELVSSSELLPFPRLHHLKDVSVDFYKNGAWQSQVSLRSSANLTDSCMHHRVAQSHGNKLRYLSGNFAETNYAKGSQGNVQFGAFLKGNALLASVQEYKETWLALYKKKKHFDDGPLRPQILPRIVIEDPRGYRSTLETFYSEGLKGEGRKTVDPVLAAVHHISGPEKSLRVHYSTQFVSTHTAKNQALRYQIEKSGAQMEDFFVLVDANFATQPYSALSHLAFAPALSLQYGTLAGRSLRELPSLPEHLKWQDNIGVYEGTKDVYGAPGDKLHAKVDYYEYVNREGERHYLVVWGSANSSKNASKGNADALHVLDTTDPSVGKVVREYFKALRTDARVFPYALAYVDRRLREAFHWDQRILNEDFLRSFADVLGGKATPEALKAIVKSLAQVPTHGAYGDNLLKLLKWHSANVGKDLDWSDFYILLELSQPGKQVPDALAQDLAVHWGVDQKAGGLRTLERTFKALQKQESFGKISSNVSRILKNCTAYLQRLGVRQTPAQLFNGG